MSWEKEDDLFTTIITSKGGNGEEELTYDKLVEAAKIIDEGWQLFYKRMKK